MNAATISRLLKMALGGVILFFGEASFCQPQPGNATPIRPSALRILRADPLPGRPAWDPFDSMISSAASFDMDSPVEAHVELDPPVASVGERVVYRVVVTALDESLEIPDPLPGPNGLELHAGGRAQIYEVSGGRKLRPQTTVLFHVVPATKGTFEMPAFDVMAYGKPVKVPATNLVVLPAGAPGAGREAPRLTVELPQGEIFVGQTVRVQLILPDAGDGTVHGMSQAGISGDFIFSEPFPIATRQGAFQSGDKTMAAFVQEVTITPMRQGAQRLVAQANAIAIRPIPGQTNGAMQTYQMLIDSDPFTLNVTPLPAEGKLPGFTGGVGEFQMEPPRLSTNAVRAGEPVTVTVFLRGEGNLGRLTPPPAPTDRAWQTFPPMNESGMPAGFMRGGITTFSYPLIPLSDQVKSTPPIPFSYFDPKQKVYVDLTIPSVPITVSPATESTAQASAMIDTNSPASDDPNREKEPVLAALAKTPGRAASGLKPVQQRWWFLVFQLAPTAALGGLWAWDRRRRHLEAHPEIVLKRRARRGLRRELRRARRAAAAQDAPGFVTGAINAFREACAPHGAANPEALVCADVLRELPAADQQGQSAEAVRRLFTAADAMRFGGAGKNGVHLLSLQPELERLLEQLKMRL